MSEPSRSTSRRLIAGASLAVLAVGGAGFTLGRRTAEPPPVAMPAPAPEPAPAPAPVLPIAPPTLGRADLITAAAAAADAYASGRPVPENVVGLVGREVELRLPLACPGGPPAADANWTYDADEEALRVRAEPVQWSPEEWLPTPAAASGQAPAAVEAIEGFWVPWPWMSGETCPAPAAPPPIQPAQGPAKGHTLPDVSFEKQAVSPVLSHNLALAEFFLPGSSRVGRRDGNAYRAVERVAADALDLSQGLRLRIRGRIARSPAGPPILCRGPTTSPPVCLVSVQFSQVAFENPASGTTIATWDVAGPDPRSSASEAR